MIRLLVFAVGCIAVSGCNLIASGCTTQLNSVIQVDVFDSLTNAPAAGGSVITLDGTTGLHDVISVPDTMKTEFGHTWFEDRVRAGSYNVQVAKPGYRLWTRSGIIVHADRCHSTSHEHLIVRLQR